MVAFLPVILLMAYTGYKMCYDLPDVFDPKFYRMSHSDLANMSEEELVEHYHAYGKSEGRLPSTYALRENFISLISPDSDALEIGPFTKPIVHGKRVRYFDVLDQRGLVERAQALNYPIENPPEIDYVSPNGDLSIVGDTFDAVVSSHCIEHQPDLVRHLQLVDSLLRPGGRYYLIIPDKRYCFDHFIPESTIVDVITAHVERRNIHTLQSLIEHRAFICHNDPHRHWAGDHGELVDVRRLADLAAQEWRDSNGQYIDVHAWQFTPASFEQIINDLHSNFELISLQSSRVFPTPYGRLEFCAILKKA